MDLIKELKLLDKTIESRRRFSDLLVDNKQLQEVLEIAKNKEMDDDLSEKAISALEFYSRAHLGKLSPYLPDIILIGQNAGTSASKRGIAKIYEAILEEDLKNNNTIKTPELKSISSVCFDWFLGDEPPAVKVFSMSVLFYTGQRISWIHPELKAILRRNLFKESKAYKARGKKILKKLE